MALMVVAAKPCAANSSDAARRIACRVRSALSARRVRGRPLLWTAVTLLYYSLTVLKQLSCSDLHAVTSDRGRGLDMTDMARHWIDRAWLESELVADSCNPATRELLGRFADGGEAEARAAVSAAR